VSSVSQLPAQQSHDELHDIVFSLHTSPFGLQPIGFLHTPMVAGALMTHVTGIPDAPGKPADPQQSPSCAHRSPTTWHPLAGWQMSTPVGPYGAHARLQHPPPHDGRPPSTYTTPPSAPVPPQSTPSTIPQLAGPPGGEVAQVPRAWLAVLVHWPLQQSVPAAHESPPCPQKDDGWHVPLLAQLPEQQWAEVVQSLPTVEQVAFSGVQRPLPQAWLQHSPPDVHDSLSEVQAG
jgi:hypothetical protein